MADPVSVTFGVIGLTATALTATKALKTFIDNIKDAPTAVNLLSSDTQALTGALEALQSILDEGETRFTPAQARIIRLLEAPLENCTKAVRDIDTTLRPFFSETEAGTKITKWRSLKLTFKQGEMTMLQNTLIAYKQSLDIAINVVSFSSITDGFEDFKQSVGHVKDQLKDLHEKIEENQHSDANANSEGSETAGTDYGFALRRFILETESAMEELPSGDATNSASGALVDVPRPEQARLIVPSSTLLPAAVVSEASKAYDQAPKQPLWSDTTITHEPGSVKEYWLPGFGLSRNIVLSNLQYFLGPSATVRPYSYHGREGYLINGLELTKQQIVELRSLSQEYERQQSMRMNRTENLQTRRKGLLQ